MLLFLSIFFGRKKTKEELQREKEVIEKKKEKEKLSRMKIVLNVKEAKHDSADALGDEYVLNLKTYSDFLFNFYFFARLAVNKDDRKGPMLVYPFLEDMPSGEEVNIN